MSFIRSLFHAGEVGGIVKMKGIMIMIVVADVKIPHKICEVVKKKKRKEREREREKTKTKKHLTFFFNKRHISHKWGNI